MLATRDNFPLLAELLAEQHRLDTPVARFSTAHDSGGYSTTSLAPQLIPLTAPRPGEQYAFEVDLDACTGCKSCVAACHSLNGLDEEETWRDVGLLVSDNRHHPFTQTITSACHHCEDPGCLNGCPVLAYEKDPLTGIVRHLDDQCIGCSYCILKCPYDVPKYSSRLGIVRKCDMCHGRLSHGEAPACAQACPTHAIRITVVPKHQEPSTKDHSEVGPDLRAGRGLKVGATVPSRPEFQGDSQPDSQTRQSGSDLSGFQPPVSSFPNPHSALHTPQSSAALATHPAILGDVSYTRPTTRYVSRRPLPVDLIAGDSAHLRPQPAHWPLAVLLTLMCLAVGCSVIGALPVPVTYYVTRCGWLAGMIGLAASVLHLGQPTRAWRIFLGLRTSWLSREAVVFGGWAAIATAAIVSGFLPPTFALARVASLLSAISAVIGALGLFCSVMIYADTRRHFWRFAHTAPRFFGSALVLGLTTALACSGAAHASRPLAYGLVAAVAFKLLFEAQALAPLNGDRDTLTPELKTARLLVGPLRPVNELRVACGVIGGMVLPVILATTTAPAWLAWPAALAVLAGELLERSLFFRAVDAPKMPGVAQ